MAEAKPHTCENPLALNISQLRGVGAKTSEALASAGLNSIFDLLLRVPKSVVEELDCPGFAHMESGRTYVATGVVLATKVTGSHFKKRLEAIIKDDSGRMSVIFFGPAVNFAHNLLKTDATVTLIGEAKNFLGRMQMVHPKIVADVSQAQPSNQSKYSQLSGLKPKTFKSVVDKALSHLASTGYGEHLPPELLSKLSLSPLDAALFHIHHPEEARGALWDQRSSDPHFGRLAFEELLSFYISIYIERRAQELPDALLIPKRPIDELVDDVLPFKLTSAQERVVNEIMEDLNKNQAMSRLVQGDVGSGKTAVSALAALLVVLGGAQVAVMAPTEILAEQLAFVYKKFLAARSIRVALITASTKTKERHLLCQMIHDHAIDIVIGTHALLSEDVQFKKLGMVIIDEQHRFGVKQRAALLQSCKNAQGFTPHLLVMSATPIPRSLALTMHGDLDLSVIDERPAGRLPITTKILSGPPLSSLERLGDRIILSQQKAFVVFPLVEESEHLDLENATKAATMLKERFGAESCLLLHGRMSAAEKQQVMQKFRTSAIPFLVSTTVVEVGVDIPDATCMAIVHPERFGLAQLHQLRGRVGRGQLASYCFLLTDLKNRFGAAFRRLDALCRSENGFELAQIDLEIRGPGELLGTRQAGMPNFHIFNHSDFARLVDPAKKLARMLVHGHRDHRVSHLFPVREAHLS